MNPKPSKIREKEDQTNERRRDVAACILHISTDALSAHRASALSSALLCRRLTGPSASVHSALPRPACLAGDGEDAV